MLFAQRALLLLVKPVRRAHANEQVGNPLNYSCGFLHTVCMGMGSRIFSNNKAYFTLLHARSLLYWAREEFD